MHRVNSFLHSHRVELSSLPLDEALLSRITQDLRENAKEHTPADVWLAAAGSAHGEAAASFSAENLLGPWLGFASTQLKAESAFWYHRYLSHLDCRDILARYFEQDGSPTAAGAELLVADLGSIVDVAIASAFANNRADQPLRVVEVGGGHGRLAEAFFNMYPGQVKWLLVDAVPSSLLYAYEYLTRSNPELRIGAYYRGDTYDLDVFDCYIAPIWHMAGPKSFDLAVNVQSMQEMDQHHVDYYLQWFDSMLRPEGVTYLCNRRGHVFRGEWRYPDHWECLLRSTQPRSLIHDFPVEVFRKGARSFATENQLRERLYRAELERNAELARAVAASRGYAVY